VRSPGEFREFYERELVPAIEPFERQRRRAMRRAFIAGAVSLAITIGVGIYGLAGAGHTAPAAVMVAFPLLLVGAAAAVLSYWLSLRDYAWGFKREVVGRVVSFLEPGLSYRQDVGVSQATFRSGRLFEHDIDRYKREDGVTGTVGRTEVFFSEVHAEYYSRGSKGEKHWHTLFKGLYFTADFNKHFRSKTVVVPDVAERVLGGWLGNLFQKINFSRSGKLVKLENPDFERHYVVYADDPFEARYILTPVMMERLIEFRERPETGDEVFVSFADSRVHIAVPMDRNLFEGDCVREP
jgi:hypothetical protein